MSHFRTLDVSDPRFESEGLRFVTVKSPALIRRADLLLYVPEVTPTQKALPLVILLHGVYGSHGSWAFKGGAHRTAARLAQQGLIPPMALAMPSDGLFGDGSGYLSRPEGDFEKWIVDEVPWAAAETCPAINPSSPLFICGLSMGGFGAMRLGAKHGTRFRGISAHSSITRIEEMKSFVEEPVDPEAFDVQDQSVLQALLLNRHQLPPIRLDCGTADNLLESNRALHRGLDESGVPHSYEEFPGGHEWSYWEKHLEDSLNFFAGILCDL